MAISLFWDGSFGGVSDNKFSGIRGSFAECVGIDGHTTPGILQARQRLAKDSGSTVTELCNVSVAVSTGESYWFSYTSGKIWQRSADGTTWTLIYTTSPAAGNAGCLGAAEFNGYLYWATQSRLHRISMTTAHASSANWTANAAPNWATFTLTDAEFHPMCVQNKLLFIGDNHQIAQVDQSANFTPNVLALLTPFRAKCIIPYDIDLLIGTYVANTVNKGMIFRWDTVALNWNTANVIEEPGINSFFKDDNYIYANVGLAGNIYYYDGNHLVAFKKIPGTYSATSYGTVSPNASANFMGVPVIGFSNGSGNPCKQGVYSLGSYSRDYRKVLDLSYPISTGNFTGLTIGAIAVLGFDLMVAWQDGSNYGVDKIDWTTKYASAYVETMMLEQNQREVVKNMGEVDAYYNSLPANTDITPYYSINGGAYVSMAHVTDVSINRIKAPLSWNKGIGSLQLKYALTTSGNNSPTIEAFGYALDA